ncbi:MAG: hypothetical protein OEY23_16730, partial [Acidimicrobiia bacterium]|nr:hypothetical protein [Acidimicrobiia bacterium]
MGPVRIEISGGGGPAEAAVRVAARHLDIEIVDCRVTRVVLLDRDPGAGALQRLCDAVLADPVIETWAVVKT